MLRKHNKDHKKICFVKISGGRQDYITRRNKKMEVLEWEEKNTYNFK